MLLRRQVSEDRDEHIDMTPMVDVVFQLMTFMLFSVQLTQESRVEVPRAHRGVGVEEDAATFLTLVKPDAPGSPPKLLLGNGGGDLGEDDLIRPAGDTRWTRIGESPEFASVGSTIPPAASFPLEPPSEEIVIEVEEDAPVETDLAGPEFEPPSEEIEVLVEEDEP